MSLYEEDFVSRSELVEVLRDVLVELRREADMQDKYMSVKEIAEWLGLSEHSVNKWIDDGVWPYLQPSGPYGARRVRRSEILKSEKRGLLY